MTARQAYEDGAGDWVAYREELSRDGTRQVRHFLKREPSMWVSTTVTAGDAVRFDTKAEALAAAGVAWPVRGLGVRKGAERIRST